MNLVGFLNAASAGIDLDHGEQGREGPLERQQVAELLLDHVADHALGLSTQHVKRIGFHLGVGRPLQRQQPDLWSVTVTHDEPVLLGHRS